MILTVTQPSCRVPAQLISALAGNPRKGRQLLLKTANKLSLALLQVLLQLLRSGRCRSAWKRGLTEQYGGVYNAGSSDLPSEQLW